MHRSQALLVVLLAFLAGVLLASFVAILEQAVLVMIALGVLVLAVSAYHRTFGTSARGIARRKVGFLIGSAVIMLAGGVLQYQHFDADHSRLTQFNDRQVGGKNQIVVVRGYVDGDVANQAGALRFPLRVKEIYVPGRKLLADERILVTTSVRLPLAYGDGLVIRGAPMAPRSDGEFDYALYLKKQGIRTTMTTAEVANDSQSLKLSKPEHARMAIYRALFKVKQRFTTALARSVNEPHAAYLAGILIGARQNIPDDLTQAFQRTGTTHILAISGYNIAIIANVVMALLLLVVRRRVAFWLTMIVLVLFTILTGASASVVRAAIMGMLVLIATGYGRLYDAKLALVLAAAFMVAFNPFILVLDVGFQLSFLAVIGLVWIYPLLDGMTKRWKIPAAAKELVLMTLAAQIATLPLIVGVFHTVPLLTLPANILILPFIPFTMLAGFITGIIGMVAVPVGRIVGSIAWALAQEQLGVIRWLASFSFASASLTLSWWVVGMIYAVLAAGTLWLYRKYASR